MRENCQGHLCSPGGTVLVCFAVPQEKKFFAPPPKLPCRAVSLVTGIGAQNAAAALAKALSGMKPQAVVTCGFAGGLNPDLSLGKIIFSEDAGAAVRSHLIKLGAVPVRFLQSDRIAVSREEKRLLRERSGADAVEMESKTIQDACRARGIQSLVIRAISDTAEQDLPLDFNQLMTKEMKINFPKLLWRVATRPGRVPALLQLQRHSTLAARALGQVLEDLLQSGMLLAA